MSASSAILQRIGQTVARQLKGRHHPVSSVMGPRPRSGPALHGQQLRQSRLGAINERRSAARSFLEGPEMGGWERLQDNLMPSSALDWALEFGPDALYAGFAAASMPGASTEERLGIGAEDFAINGLVGSFGGRLAGGALGLALSRGKSGRARNAAIRSAAGTGGFIGSLGMGFSGIRPYYNSVADRLAEEQSALYQQQQESLLQQGIAMGSQQIAASPRVAGAGSLLDQLASYGY